MSDQYTLGIDVGTGSARACIVDFTGELLAEVSKPIKTWNSKANFYVGDHHVYRVCIQMLFLNDASSKLKHCF